MYAYCNNNPVIYVDRDGRSIDAIDYNPEDDHRELDKKDIGPTGVRNDGGGSGSSANVSNVPQHAWDTLNYIQNNNGTPPNGYVGGNSYANDGRGGTKILPNDAPDHEYDVHIYVRGQWRGAERIVIGASGTAWYTPDHYRTFILME